MDFSSHRRTHAASRVGAAAGATQRSFLVVLDRALRGAVAAGAPLLHRLPPPPVHGPSLHLPVAAHRGGRTLLPGT